MKSLLGQPLGSGREVIIIPSQAYYHVSYKKQQRINRSDTFSDRHLFYLQNVIAYICVAYFYAIRQAVTDLFVLGFMLIKAYM